MQTLMRHSLVETDGSSTRGCGSTNFIFNSNVLALPVEILVEPGQFPGMPLVLCCADKVDDPPNEGDGRKDGAK